METIESLGFSLPSTAALESHADRGNDAFSFLAIETVPDYLGTAVRLAVGTSTAWEYEANLGFYDEQISQWKDVVSMSVMG